MSERLSSVKHGEVVRWIGNELAGGEELPPAENYNAYSRILDGLPPIPQPIERPEAPKQRLAENISWAVIVGSLVVTAFNLNYLRRSKKSWW
jgi:hypothetical protein